MQSELYKTISWAISWCEELICKNFIQFQMIGQIAQWTWNSEMCNL